MRIRWLEISAYGVLVGQRLEATEGLTVVFGRNEAGKTTLKRFVETMLFGFEDDDVDGFSPWHGGRRDFGGELSYELDGGESFLIRRHYDASIRTKRDRERASLLRGVDGSGGRANMGPEEIGRLHLKQRRAIFRTVFSIDLSALMALNELGKGEREEMARVFFRELATAGEVANPREVEKQILDRAQKICKFGGSRKRAETDEFKRNDLRQAKTALDEARRAAEEADAAQALIVKYGMRRDELADERAALQAEIARQQSLGPAAEAYRRLVEADQALAELDAEPGIDETAIEQLEEALSERSAQAKVLEQLREGREAAESQLNKLRDQLRTLPDVEARAGVIERLAAAHSLHEDLAKRLPDQEAEVRLGKERLLAELTDLVTSDDPLASPAMEMTRARNDELVAAIDRYETHQDEADDRRRRLRDFSEQVAELASQIHRLAQGVPDDFPSDYRPEQLRELLAIEREFQAVQAGRQRVEERQRQLKDDRRHLETARKDVAVGQGTLRAAVHPAGWYAWAAVLVIGLIGVGYGGYTDQDLWALAGMPLVIVAIVKLRDLWRRRQEALQATELVETSPLLRSLVERIEDAAGAIEREVPTLDEAGRGLAGRYTAAGFASDPDVAAVGEAIERLRRFDDCRDEHRQLTRLREEHHRLSAKVDDLRAEVDGDAERLAQERHEIETALAGLDLAVPANWTPRRLRDRSRLVARLGERLTELRRLEDAVNRQRERVETYLGDVRAVAESISGPDRAPLPEGADGPAAAPAVGAVRPDPNEQPYAFVRYVADLLTRARSLRERLPEREAEAGEAGERCQKADDRLGQIDRRVEDLSMQLGLETADDLPALRETHRQRSAQRTQLEATVRSRREQLDDLRQAAGLPDDWVPEAQPADEADGETSGQTPEQLGVRLSDMQQEINQVSQEIFRLEEELAKQRSASPVAVAEGAYEACLDRLAERYERFDALLVAQRLLERAMQRYRQQRQPAIVQRAQDYLKDLTAGRYDSLQTDLLDSSRKLGEIYVIPSAGQPRDARYFSRGSREQVYLALRLALADELSQDEPLPLILDDVLANFDGERFEATADLLVRLGRKRQMLFLTCHDAVRDALAQRGAAIRELA